MQTLVADKNYSTTWDVFVSNHPAGHFMQSYGWGHFRARRGWRPFYLLAKEDEQIKGAMLVFSKTLPLGKSLYYAPRGPVVDFGDQQTLLALFKKAKELMQKRKGIFLRLDPYLTEGNEFIKGLEHSGLNPIPRQWSFWNGPKFVFWLDLNKGADFLFKKLASKTRNDIRFPYKNGVTFETGSRADLPDFYRLMEETARLKGIGIHDTEYYRDLYETLTERDMIRLFLAKHGGETISAAMSIKYGAKAWLMYAASGKKHYRLRASRALQWEMIKWACEEGCTRYDFRGTATSDPPNPKDPGYGVYEFKKSFGPEFTRLAGYYDLINHNVLHKLFRFGEDYALPILFSGWRYFNRNK